MNKFSDDLENLKQNKKKILNNNHNKDNDYIFFMNDLLKYITNICKNVVNLTRNKSTFNETKFYSFI